MALMHMDLKAAGVIFDWAGTTVDYGCRGPVAVFSRAFEKFGIFPTDFETRQPMGREKKEHVAAMLSMPRIEENWLEIYGRKPDDKDVANIFALVQELMPATLADFAEPVPQCGDVLEQLRHKNIKIGSCTGYSRNMMTELIPRATAGGFAPDCLVTADEVPQGRPYPWMCWQNCMKLGLFPPETVVKVGDTVADIKEGLNAGHWSVAVVRSSNAMGKSAAELEAMSEAERLAREKEIAGSFRKAGAHYVIATLAELPDLCEEISECLAMGRLP